MSDVQQILADLVAFPSVCRTPNGAIVAYVREHLARHGIAAQIIPGPEGDRSNLFATLGPREVPGYILSAHLDVVPAPAAGWTGDPFRLRRAGDRLIGRGAVDMKGFVACLLATLPEIGRDLQRPLHIALSYDEEVGCVGVRHLIARLPEFCAPPLGCIVGEPSDLHPVLRHKGKVAGRLIVRGRAGHSSRPDLAENAVHHAADLVGLVRDLHERLSREGPFHPAFEPPASTLQVGVIAGGTSVNVVPDQCAIDWEARAIPGTDPMALHAALEEAIAAWLAPLQAEGRPVQVESEVLSGYPALDLPDHADLRAMAEDLSGREARGAVSFGTEAGLYQAAGIPAIICGPGSIAQAHKPDEFIAAADLDACCAMLRRLAARLR
ncbi:acetylornithine deacetylase [Methylobacterium nodulans]|uniref:Acetylornithine deacetylase (ArgE) n=1 Tax=Methylobacterium nodulans (strain LMG 21967 / CNCM I-2342 / ORS 2060) TaxID=460265 RepID=B8IQ59_METNO|nr:acetylornithine deacetylase [Methylobacterium nodulans]ACL58559.1 acetylornithine deacetylase (ArgE) [Methylobacterium nodulans ORS 2060]